MGVLSVFKIVPFILLFISPSYGDSDEDCVSQLKSIVVPRYAEDVSSTKDFKVVYKYNNEKYPVNCGEELQFSVISIQPEVTYEAGECSNQNLTLMAFDVDGNLPEANCDPTKASAKMGSMALMGMSPSSNDDPSPSERVHLLWLIVNINKDYMKNSDLTKGNVVVSYVAPSKINAMDGKNTHNIVFLVFCQPKFIDEIVFTGNLRCFKPKEYASEKNLGSPIVAQNYKVQLNAAAMFTKK